MNRLTRATVAAAALGLSGLSSQAMAADNLPPVTTGLGAQSSQAMTDTIDSLLLTGNGLQTSDPAPTGTNNGASAPTSTIRTVPGMPDSTDQIISTGNALQTSDPFTIPAVR